MGASQIQKAQPWIDKMAIQGIAFIVLPAAIGLGVHFQYWEIPEKAQYIGMIVMMTFIICNLIKFPDYLLATIIIYLPFTRTFEINLAPGINITNLLLILLLLARYLLVQQDANRKSWSDPNGTLVSLWAFLSLASILTAMVRMGPGFIFSDQLILVKGWLDQFIIYFCYYGIVRDQRSIQRTVIYMMVATIFVSIWGADEWIARSNARSMDEAAITGPQLQRNDFGAFITYSAGIFLALFFFDVFNYRTWIILPILYLILRLLLGTFSRGSYLGFGLALFLIIYAKGKKFLLGTLLLAVITIAVFPQLIPGSMKARLQQTTTENSVGKEAIDPSAQTRLILWKAAFNMILESPFIGKGFGTFPYLKGQYTEIPVPERDNHNMYLYIASQMGVPVLVIFVMIIYRLYRQGLGLYRRSHDINVRIIGLGAVAMAGGVFMINMFGSRMVDISVMGYIWIYLAIISRLEQQQIMVQFNEACPKDRKMQ